MRRGDERKQMSQEERQRSQEDWQQFKAALVNTRIDRRHRLYKRHHNPIHALEAYRMARAFKGEIPNWILELIDHWAAALCVNSPTGAKPIADALGLGAKGGGPSITSQAKKQARGLEIAERVLFLRDRYPSRDKLDIFGQVAEEFSLSSERVAGIWYDLTRGVK